MSNPLLGMVWNALEKSAGPMNWVNVGKEVAPAVAHDAPAVVNALPKAAPGPSRLRDFASGTKNLAMNAALKPGFGAMTGYGVGEAVHSPYTQQMMRNAGMGNTAEALDKYTPDSEILAGVGAGVGGRNVLRNVPWASTAGGKDPRAWTSSLWAGRRVVGEGSIPAKLGDPIARASTHPMGAMTLATAGTYGLAVPQERMKQHNETMQAITSPNRPEGALGATWDKVQGELGDQGMALIMGPLPQDPAAAAQVLQARDRLFDRIDLRLGKDVGDQYRALFGPNGPYHQNGAFAPAATPQPSPNQPAPTPSATTPTTPTNPATSRPASDKGFLGSLPNWAKGLGVGVGALGAGLLADSFSGDEEDEDGKRRKKMPWLGPLVGAGGLAAGLGYLSDWDYGKLLNKDFWMNKTSASRMPMVVIPYRIKFAFNPVVPQIPGLPKVQTPQLPTPQPPQPAPMPKMPAPTPPAGYKPQQPAPASTPTPPPAPVPQPGPNGQVTMPKPQVPQGYTPQQPATPPTNPWSQPNTAFSPSKGPMDTTMRGQGQFLGSLQGIGPNAAITSAAGTAAGDLTGQDVSNNLSEQLKSPQGKQNVTNSIAGKLMARGIDPNDPNQAEQGKQRAASEIAKANPDAAAKPGFMDMIGIWWDGLDMMQKVLVIGGLGIGAMSLLGGLGGGGDGEGGGMMGPLLGIAGLGAAAYGAGLFDENSVARQWIGGRFGVERPQGDPNAPQGTPQPAKPAVSYFDAQGNPNKLELLQALPKIQDAGTQKALLDQFLALPPEAQQKNIEQLQQLQQNPAFKKYVDPIMGILQSKAPGGTQGNFNAPGGNPAVDATAQIDPAAMESSLKVLIHGTDQQFGAMGNGFESAPPQMQAAFVDAAHKQLETVPKPSGNPVTDQYNDAIRQRGYSRVMHAHNDIATGQLQLLLSDADLPPGWGIEKIDSVSRNMMIQKLQKALDPNNLSASGELGLELTPDNLRRANELLGTLRYAQASAFATQPLTGSNLVALKQAISDRNNMSMDWSALMREMTPQNQAVVRDLLTSDESQMAADSLLLRDPNLTGLLSKNDPKAVSALTRQLTHHNSDWIGVSDTPPEELAQFGSALDAAEKLQTADPNNPQLMEARKQTLDVIRRNLKALNIAPPVDDNQLIALAKQLRGPLMSSSSYMGTQRAGNAMFNDPRNYLFGSKGRLAGLRTHIPGLPQADAPTPGASVAPPPAQSAGEIDSSNILPASPANPVRDPYDYAGIMEDERRREDLENRRRYQNFDPNDF